MTGHDAWKSTTIAEGFVENVSNKETSVAVKILGMKNTHKH
jgi:hypothetical protein